VKVTLNDVEYTGIKGLLIAIPSLIFIGFIFLFIGAALTSPLWGTLLLLGAFS
jgi:hypothetical protein